ncbi:MAG: prepilin-type N-terminal cleavage/methylation domain-containing protein [Verrucomicrobiota bacterium]
MKPAPHCSRRGQGFTLVEILCATAVSSILMAALASMLVSSLDAYSSQERRTNTTVESRAGLEMLRMDLRSYCALPDDPTTAADDLLTRFMHVQAGSPYLSDRFAFLRYAKPPMASVTLMPDYGNLVLVAYGVAFTPDVGGRSSPKLYRRLFTADETYARLRAHLSTGGPLLSETDWQTITSPASGTPAGGAAGTATAASVAEPVIFQVVQFRAKPLRTLYGVAGDPTTANGIASLANNLVWPEQTSPACVDILLRVTNRATAAKLTTAADWRGEGAFSQLLLGSAATLTDYRDDREVETQQLRTHLPRP